MQGSSGMQQSNRAGFRHRLCLPNQVETPLELAAGLSLSLGNRLFLKREDLQPVSAPPLALYPGNMHACMQQLA